jgi:superfamily II DNA or RNA helicase
MLPPEVLRMRLPAAANRLIRQGATPEDLAAAIFAVFGVEALRKLAPELRDGGWEAPHVWAGSEAARRFVESLGFPREFAGFPGTTRLPFLEVDGPLELKALHEFQEQIVKRIHAFLRPGLPGAAPGRGLLSLPTGAGKTRVVIEALIRGIAANSLHDLVVWIAQSDELCEQAVQSWGQAWRAIGPQHKRLRISRLWGATNNSVSPTDRGAHVVVSTYQTLTRRIADPVYSWLWAPGCVVIDEAHGSTARSYTAILSRLGLTQRETPRPLIGLSATPFRGTNEEETRRLVRRYHGRRFDADLFGERDPYSVLQEQEILARVSHMTLEGVEISLSQEERVRFNEYGELPREVEVRIGRNEVRNERILQSISELPRTWPVLVFAASVEHAQVLAALLTLKGIEAYSISSETDPGARRHYIEEFRRQRIRVLTNYNVLATGFDAPAVRALYVTRPVFSPGLYQQMIGRGLRGPRNGGKKDFLLVNVNDNEGMYGRTLAFRAFEGLWGPGVEGQRGAGPTPELSEHGWETP